jgi:hypothetical protein
MSDSEKSDICAIVFALLFLHSAVAVSVWVAAPRSWDASRMSQQAAQPPSLGIPRSRRRWSGARNG